MAALILLLVVAVLAFRIMTPDMRATLPRSIISAVSIAVASARKRGRQELAPFLEALRARTPRVWVTPAIVLVSVLVFLGLSFDHTGRSATALLVAWGGSVGPRTTNGEWWRLATMMVVHAGLVGLLVNMAAVIQVGCILERLVGRLAVVAVFVAAGLMGAVTMLALRPLAVSYGASSAVLGLYGMFAVAVIAGRLRRSELTIPVVAIRRCAWIAALVMFVSVTDQAGAAAADLVGFTVGIGLGIAMVATVPGGIPEPRRIAWSFGPAAVIAIAAAVPLHGIFDVEPELRRLVAMEQQTTHTYEAAATKFKSGAMNGAGLADAIDDAIVPVLQAANERFATITHVPPEDQPKLTDARRYLRLRIVSWTLRAQSLRESEVVEASPKSTGADPAAVFRARATARHRASELTRGKAESAEREALEIIDRLGATPPAAAGSD